MSDRFDQLSRKLYQLPYGSARIALLEEFIRESDSLNDKRSAFKARDRLIREAKQAGLPDKMLVAFSWCLAQYDKDPKITNYWSPIGEYKIILEYVPVFPAISRSQIESLQEDMATRLVARGQNERTAHYFRSWNFMRMGDYERAREFQDIYTKMPQTITSDCSACERDRQVELMSRMKLHDECLQLAAPILGGKMRCAEVPGFTNGHVMRTYLRMGRFEEASELFPSAYRITRGEMNYVATLGDLLLLLARTKSYKIGTELIEQTLPLAVETTAVELRMRFFGAVAVFLERHAEMPGADQAKIQIPRKLECRKEGDEYDLAELAQWFKAQAEALADQFDLRNGNRAQRELLEDNRVLAGLV